MIPKSENHIKDSRLTQRKKEQPVPFFQAKLFNIQRKCNGCDEEVKKLNRKEAEEQGTTAGAGVESYISRLNGSGKSLDTSTKSFFEPRFGQDFSAVRIHHDSEASKSAQAVNSLAYTVGNNIVFNSNQYSPETREGKKLLGHELAHVTQQRQLPNDLRIQPWAASVHQELTTGVINKTFPSDFSENARIQLSFYSGQLDQRLCNYLYYLQDFVLPTIPILGPLQDLKLRVPTYGKEPRINEYKPFNIQNYKLSEYEAPNHGEANRYMEENLNKTGEGTKTILNQQRMEEHLGNSLFKANKDGITREVLIDLGLALHVGQDRGSHEEGIFNRGHSRKTDAYGNKWETDNPAMNNMGYSVAKTHTVSLLLSFISRLSPSLKKQLANLNLSSLAGTPVGIPLLEDVPLQGQGSNPSNLNPPNPVTYMCIIKDMPTTKDGLPKRLFGMLPYLYQLDVGAFEGNQTTFFVNPQVGLRMAQITPYVYLDVLAGTVIGTGVDQRAAFGISTGFQMGFTKGKIDANLMFNHFTNLQGLPPLTVVGINIPLP